MQTKALDFETAMEVVADMGDDITQEDLGYASVVTGVHHEYGDVVVVVSSVGQSLLVTSKP